MFAECLVQGMIEGKARDRSFTAVLEELPASNALLDRAMREECIRKWFGKLSISLYALCPHSTPPWHQQKQ
jgi:hypothetical protein